LRKKGAFSGQISFTSKSELDLGVKMGQLVLQCPKCQHIIGTGISMDLQSFKNSTLIGNKTRCPKCGSMVTWNKKNILDI
jgi:endogenous inhibitor of DNA gyrase (YacG/DUF329 family)